MKLTQYDDLYPSMLGMGGTTLIASDGSNSGSTGGDIDGNPGDFDVVGLGGTVSLGSNLSTGVVLGDVLTIIQASPAIARFSTPSNSAGSFGSNSTRVSETASAGASTSLARADHIHDGIGTITASSSNTMQRGTFNLRPGSNVSFGLTDTDGDGEFDTLSVNASASGSSGGGNVSTVATTNIDYGRATLLAYGSLISATYGDHFDTSSLDAKWNAYSGSRSNCDTTTIPGWANATSGGAMLIQAIPGGNWTIEAEVMPPGSDSTAYQDTGLIVTSGSAVGSSTDMRLGVGMNNSYTSFRIVWEKFINGAFSSTYASVTFVPLVTPIYLRLQWDGSNFRARWSYNRLKWYAFDTTKAPGFTPAHFGVNLDASGACNYFDKVA